MKTITDQEVALEDVQEDIEKLLDVDYKLFKDREFVFKLINSVKDYFYNFIENNNLKEEDIENFVEYTDIARELVFLKEYSATQGKPYYSFVETKYIRKPYVLCEEFVGDSDGLKLRLCDIVEEQFAFASGQQHEKGPLEKTKE